MGYASLGKDYGYTPRAIEHDGLLTENPIPNAAIAKARELSGFHTAILEEVILRWYESALY